jgi:ABC-type phosphate transport system permease subunit
MKDFDKSFDRMQSLIMVFFVIVFLLIIGIWVFYGVVGVKVYKAIDKDGLKSVVEEVWNGPDKSNNSGILEE